MGVHGLRLGLGLGWVVLGMVVYAIYLIVCCIYSIHLHRQEVEWEPIYFPRFGLFGCDPEGQAYIRWQSRKIVKLKKAQAEKLGLLTPSNTATASPAHVEVVVQK